MGHGEGKRSSCFSRAGGMGPVILSVFCHDLRFYLLPLLAPYIAHMHGCMCMHTQVTAPALTSKHSLKHIFVFK